MEMLCPLGGEVTGKWDGRAIYSILFPVSAIHCQALCQRIVYKCIQTPDTDVMTNACFSGCLFIHRNPEHQPMFHKLTFAQQHNMFLFVFVFQENRWSVNTLGGV